MSSQQHPQHPPNMLPQFVDDKAPICIPFIIDILKTHRHGLLVPSSAAHGAMQRPLIIGLNGMQGAGKTTLVAALAAALEKENTATLVCSIDDFYLTHDDQQALARENASNALLQHRGEPGTHDVSLAKSFFSSVIQGKPAKLPQYDKAAFSGQGDRLPESEWKLFNQPGEAPLQVIILEGWSVGFRPLTNSEVEAKWKAPSRTLHQHQLEHLLYINEKLREYDAITDLFDAFIHIDAEEVEFVYKWRLEQEDHLRVIKGDQNAGMTSDQVIKFVDGYFPGYELYTEGVRNGILPQKPRCQLRLVVGHDRTVKHTIYI